MTFKKIMLITFLLLAILTIGAASASDNATSDDMAVSGEEADIQLPEIDENISSEPDSGEALEDGEITEGNFGCWVADCASKDRDGDHVCNFQADEHVEGGTIYLTVTNPDGDNKTYENHIGGESNEFIWKVNDLDILDELGVYTFNVKYSDGVTEIALKEDFSFQLLEMDIDKLNGEVYLNYPYDVIRIYEDSSIVVLVNGEPRQSNRQNPYGWTLNDLEIGSAGDYNITIRSLNEDDSVNEEFSYFLNVVGFDDGDFRIFSYFNQVLDENAQVLRIYSSADKQGKIAIEINGDFLENPYEITPNDWLNLTLGDLGIDENEYYEVNIYHVTDDNPEGEQIGVIGLDVGCIIDEGSFNCWVADNHAIRNDWEVCNVEFNERVVEGNITLTVEKFDGSVKDYCESVEGTDRISWTLEDLDIIDEVGRYNFAIRYISNTKDIELANRTVDVTVLEYNIADDGRYTPDFKYDFIQIGYCGDENVRRFEIRIDGNDSPLEFDAEKDQFSLADFGIDSTGTHNITITSYNDDGEVETYEFSIEVHELDTSKFSVNINPMGVPEDYEGDVLSIYCPDYANGTLIIEFEDFNVEIPISSEMCGEWTYLTLENLTITKFGDYQFSIKNVDEDDGESYIDEWRWLNVHGFYRVLYENDGEIYIDAEDDVIWIELYKDFTGTIVVDVNGSDVIRQIEDGEDYYGFTLEDLDITETGEYNITVKYINEDDEVEVWDSSILNVIEFNNDTFRAIINTNKRYIDFFCPQGEEGNIQITVENDDGKFVYNFDINSTYWGKWSRFHFKDLGISLAQCSNVKFEIGEYCVERETNEWIFIDHVWDGENENGPLYLDSEGIAINVHVGDGKTGTLYLIMDGKTEFVSKIVVGSQSRWNVNQLNLTEPRQYNLDLKFFYDENDYEIFSYVLNVTEFNNDANRAKLDLKNGYLNVFCVEGSQNITIKIFNEEDEYLDQVSYEIDSTDYNSWKSILLKKIGIEDYWGWYSIEVNIDDEYSFRQGFSLSEANEMEGPEIGMADGTLLEDDDDEVFTVRVPYGFALENATFNVACGEYSFCKDLSEADPRWGEGCYEYPITLKDLDSFETLSDRDVIVATLRYNNHVGNVTYYSKYGVDGVLKKTDEMRLFTPSGRDWLEVGPNEMHDDRVSYNISSDGGELFAYVLIPDHILDNVSDGRIVICSGSNKIFERRIADFGSENMDYDYPSLGNVYLVYFSEIDLSKATDKDLVTIEFILQNYDVENCEMVYHLDGDTAIFYEAISEVDLTDDDNSCLGRVENIEYIARVTLPENDNGTGFVSIVCGDRVLFNKTTDEIRQDYEGEYNYPSRGYLYRIPKGNMLDDLNDGDVLEFTLVYNGTEEDYFEEKIFKDESGTSLKAIISTRDVAWLFGINITDQTLIDVNNRALHLIILDAANRQTIEWKMRAGYFNVYVNGVKIENLGYLMELNDEGEPPKSNLELFWLTGIENRDLNITIDDLGIVDNGDYNIVVTYVPDEYDMWELEYADYSESVVTSLNITLTSNVKVSYQNNTTELLTGYGIDPVLLYLDTYYGDINETTGTITVINSAGEELLSNKNIRQLAYENGRYLLKYSDFDNKDFGDCITVMYNGSERSANTTLDVMWKDVNATDFTPIVNDDVNDYYGDFINMNIPDLVNNGQIIVTIKFNNNHGSNISSMNVSTDFNSKATYKFNIADIKAVYGNSFALAMSDLGFFEANGDYDVDIRFTADGTSVLDIANKTMDVQLLNETLITINASSRHTHEMPFAGVRVFEPVRAYAVLYIDGKQYQRKTFENGQITFTSSGLWSPGTHTANITVYDSEFETVLNSSQTTFDVITDSGDVTIDISGEVKKNERVIINVTVSKPGSVTVKVDGILIKTSDLVSGKNVLDIGALTKGVCKVFISYESDDGTSFYHNYIDVTVGDDGGWLDFPNPLVLNDDDTVKMNFEEGETGTVSIYIDDRFVKNITVTGGSAEFRLDESIFDKIANGEDLLGVAESVSKYGVHNFTIIFTPDDTSHDVLSKTGYFTVAYIFKDGLNGEYPVREDYEITVTLPGDAKGNVTLDIENYHYSLPVSDGKVTFSTGMLEIGEHTVLIRYLGDERYPEAEYTTVLNVTHYAVVGKYSEDEKYMSLLLPGNATGNLTVENRNAPYNYYSIPLKNGRARLELDKMPVGVYSLVGTYTGDDYNVRQFSLSFRIMPTVIISQGVIMGDDANIYLDLDNASGHIVIARDGLNPVVVELINGIVNYTFSTEGYFYGNHSVTFMYFGKDVDGDIFFEADGKTAIEYKMLILPQNTTGEITSGGNYAEARIYDDEGNLAYDANGTVTFFINGVKVAVVDIVDGIAKLDISQYKNGRYLIRWEYSGDNKYASSSGESSMDVDHKSSSIVAADASIAYSSAKKYSVTVFNADGRPAGNVEVSFLVNGKLYKKVKTDSKGVAAVLISQKPGSYKITAKASDASVTKTLKVNHILTLKGAKVKRSAKKLVIKATLKKVDGKFLKAKKITLKFNGKKFTAKTNKKGVAKFTIKAKVLKKLKAGKKVTYQATCLKDTVKKVVKVKK